jgi:hypothetical protein
MIHLFGFNEPIKVNKHAVRMHEEVEPVVKTVLVFSSADVLIDK